MSDIVVMHNNKKLIEGIDYTVLGNIITPINNNLFENADDNGEIELIIKHTYSSNDKLKINTNIILTSLTNESNIKNEVNNKLNINRKGDLK